MISEKRLRDAIARERRGIQQLRESIWNDAMRPCVYCFTDQKPKFIVRPVHHSSWIEPGRTSHFRLNFFARLSLDIFWKMWTDAHGNQRN